MAASLHSLGNSYRTQRWLGKTKGEAVGTYVYAQEGNASRSCTTHRANYINLLQSERTHYPDILLGPPLRTEGGPATPRLA